MDHMEKWGLAPFSQENGDNPQFTNNGAWHHFSLALTSLRFFLTGNSAGDRKRPIQKEGGFNEREKN